MQACEGNGKPKVVLVLDEYGWVFHNLSLGIIKHLGHKYDFRLHRWRDKLLGDYDLVHYATYAHATDHEIPARKGVAGLVGVHGREHDEIMRCLVRCKAVAYRAKYMHEKFKDVCPCPMTYIPDAIETSMFSRNPDKPSAFTVGWNGDRNKFDKRFRALEEIMQSIPGIEFTPKIRKYVGSEPYSEVPKIYNPWHCYVCWSSEEGFGIPLVEAAASGLPVISTDVGCARALGAKIVSTPEELRAAVIEYRDNPNLAIYDGQRLQQNAIEQFDWSVVAPQYDRFFQEALEMKGAGPADKAIGSIDAWGWKNFCAEWSKLSTGFEKYMDMGSQIRRISANKNIMGLLAGSRKRILDISAGFCAFDVLARSMGHDVHITDCELPVVRAAQKFLGFDSVFHPLDYRVGAIWKFMPIPSSAGMFNLITAFASSPMSHWTKIDWGQFFFDALSHLNKGGKICITPNVSPGMDNMYACLKSSNVKHKILPEGVVVWKEE